MASGTTASWVRRRPRRRSLGEAAALLRVAGEHLEDEGALGDRRRGVDHVEDLPPGRPVGHSILARGVHRVPQGAQVLLPRERPAARPEGARGRQARLGISGAVVLRVEIDEVGLALEQIARVGGARPILVEAQEVREAIASSHARWSRDILESYPIAATPTKRAARSRRVTRAGARGPAAPARPTRRPRRPRGRGSSAFSAPPARRRSRSMRSPRP